MTETLQEPSHHTLREELQEMVVKDLLGPAGGPEEEVDEARVSDRYLVGTLAPKRKQIGTDEIDNLFIGVNDSDEEGQNDNSKPSAKSLLPSFIGMTF